MAAEVRGHLQATLEEARALAQGLSPVQIDPEGLGDALLDLNRAGLGDHRDRLPLLGERSPRVADGVVAGHLYRIAQEAVHNATRHSALQRVDVRLAHTPAGGLVLTVRDDGPGIDLAQGRRGGLWLQIMRYRAGILGGLLTVVPADGGGTLVRCEAPRQG